MLTGRDFDNELVHLCMVGGGPDGPNAQAAREHGLIQVSICLEMAAITKEPEVVTCLRCASWGGEYTWPTL